MINPLIQRRISNYGHNKVWGEIMYPSPNLKVAKVEVWEWLSNFIVHFLGRVITYPCWDQNSTMLVKVFNPPAASTVYRHYIP